MAVHHPLFARVYARVSENAERHGAAEHREELLAGLAGRVIEVGAGNGMNFAHYPATVSEVVAVEPEPYLRERAVVAAADAGVPVSVVEGEADALPAPERSFDAAVASLVLCSVPDPAHALREIHRVLRPGGELRFYEHVVDDHSAKSTVQRRLDGWGIWPHLAGGCHLSRDTTGEIAAAGFAIESHRAFGFPPGPLGLRHVLGVARRT